MAPTQQHLPQRLLVPLRQLLQGLTQQRGSIQGATPRQGCQGPIASDVDSLHLTIGPQASLLEQGMCLKLVAHRLHGGTFDALELFDPPIRHSNVLHLSGRLERHHFFPHLRKRLGEGLVLLRDGTVQKEQIEVVDLAVFQELITDLGDVAVQADDFVGDEELLSSAARLLQPLLDRLPHDVGVVVSFGQIQVPKARVQRL
mmetsp:Transcript_20552/g.34259  ORF Transcript_20552/g.34259 Transcript_20552/m.34259 type:complete len:201 (+) Transcript_20552:340-942(+)